ncbi:MAG TPA: T9SS type A sorting domain-containing protein [candidate division Zixibacteria bacterium]
MKRIIFWLFLSFFIFSVSFAVEFKVSKEYEETLIRQVEELYTNQEPIYPLPKCGTPIMAEISLLKEKLSSEALELLKFYLARPSLQRSYNTPGGHFKIHYDITGTNTVYHPSEDTNPANGIPDYVDRCAEIFDYVWAKEIDTMGYKAPPSDGSMGGDSRYDIYIINLGYGYLGGTSPESPRTPSWSYTSYIELTNDFSGYGYASQYDLMSVTAGHEFFHAIQFGYDVYEGYDPYPNWKPYWMEMSSTWMEDQTFDNVNDYPNYLRFFYRYPWVSLKAFSNDFGADSVRAYHPYASCVFAIYLSEKFGVGVMKDIWEECGRVPDANTLPAIDSALAPFGADFDSAFKEFLVWNLFTGTRANTVNYYSEGNLFPEINILNEQKHSTYPVNVTSVDSMPENLASNYVRFTPLSGPGGLDMTFNGADNAEWVVPVVGYKSGGGNSIGAFSLNAQGEGNFDFYNWDDYDYVYMTPGVLTRDSSKYNYAYADTFDINLGVDEDQLPDRMEYILPQNYPNPFNSSTNIPFTVYGSQFTVDSRIHTTLKIYNILGQEVRTLVDEPKRPGNYEITWDGKDNENRDLPSGVYFYKIETEGFVQSKKMLLLK